MARSDLVGRHYHSLVDYAGLNGYLLTTDNIESCRTALSDHPGNKIQDAIETFKKHGTNFVLQESGERIELVAHEFGELPSEVFVGEFPTESINASVMKTTDGPLILINSGTVFLFFEIAKIMASVITLQLNNKKTIPPLCTNSEILIRSVADLFLNYILEGDSSLTPRYPVPTGEHFSVYANLHLSILDFLIAHEYAHIVCGHLNHAEAKSAIDSGQPEFCLKEIDQEFEADAVATNMIVRLVQKQNLHAHSAQYPISGGVVFLSIALLIEGICADLFPDQTKLASTTHPPATVRIEKILQQLTDLGYESMLGAMVDLGGFLPKFRDYVVSLGKSVVEKL